MSAVTSARLRELRANIATARGPSIRNHAAAYLDACTKAPTLVVVWSLLRDWSRYDEAERVLIREACIDAERRGAR